MELKLSVAPASKNMRGNYQNSSMLSCLVFRAVQRTLHNNPSSRPSTRNTFFPYYLAVTDVASRFFVPLGIQDKKAKTVFNAIHE
jgi:hypothetical protein